jgi:hypothetical protein
VPFGEGFGGVTRLSKEGLLNLFSSMASQSAGRFFYLLGFLPFFLGFLNDLLCGGSWQYSTMRRAVAQGGDGGEGSLSGACTVGARREKRAWEW